MIKTEFLNRLASLLSDLPDSDRATVLDFYREIIEDKVESGSSEQEAVAGLGDIYQLSQKILNENPARKPKQANKSGLAILFTVLGVLIVISIIGSIISIPVNLFRSGTSSSVHGEIIIDGKSTSNMNRENKVYTVKASGITKIQLNAENKSIHISPSGSDQIQIHYTSDKNQTYDFSTENGIVKMENHGYNDNSFNFSIFGFHMNDNSNDDEITVSVPAEYANDITVKTTNSEIAVSNFKNLHDVSCTTTNSVINFSDVNVNNLNIETKNAAITLNHLTAANKLEAYTKNAKISLDKIASQDIELETTNAIISGTVLGNEDDYSIDSRTTNGVNNLPNRSGGSKKLKVNTTNAIINVSFSN